MAYVGNQPVRGQYRKLTNISGSFNGTATTFTTSVPPGTSSYYVTAASASQLLVSLNGVILQPDVDYTVSTNSITFTTPPAISSTFFAVLLGDALNVGTPGDGTVSNSKLAPNLQVGLAAGSAALPSLYFSGDRDNGIYSPALDQFAVVTNGAQRLFIDATGAVKVTGDNFQIATSKTPATAGATGTAGQIAWDVNYIYVCTATNTWKRAAITTW